MIRCGFVTIHIPEAASDANAESPLIFVKV
jgi:hypothetical protein